MENKLTVKNEVTLEKIIQTLTIVASAAWQIYELWKKENKNT